MAIDSAEKRRTVGGVPYLPLGVNVSPNVAKDVEWRQQAAWSYSGIAPSPPVAVTGEASGAWEDRPWQHPPHQAQAAPASSPWSFALPSRKLVFGGAP